MDMHSTLKEIRYKEAMKRMLYTKQGIIAFLKGHTKKNPSFVFLGRKVQSELEYIVYLPKLATGNLSLASAIYMNPKSSSIVMDEYNCWGCWVETNKLTVPDAIGQELPKGTLVAATTVNLLKKVITKNTRMHNRHIRTFPCFVTSITRR